MLFEESEEQHEIFEVEVRTISGIVLLHVNSSDDVITTTCAELGLSDAIIEFGGLPLDENMSFEGSDDTWFVIQRTHVALG